MFYTLRDGNRVIKDSLRKLTKKSKIWKKSVKRRSGFNQTHTIVETNQKTQQKSPSSRSLPDPICDSPEKKNIDIFSDREIDYSFGKLDGSIIDLTGIKKR